MDHDPPDNMTWGKAVLIRDAAHPLLPTHAQGSGLSILSRRTVISTGHATFLKSLQKLRGDWVKRTTFLEFEL